MLSIEIPDRYQGLAPVIVTAPSARCGTTLVQRLLSTARNGFLYGEEVGMNLKIMAGWLIGVLARLDRDHERRDQEFTEVIKGDFSGWRPGLAPPTDVTLRAALETFYQIPMSLAEHANYINRPVWGFKCPGFDHDTIVALLALMPNARVVYLLRNPIDVLRSAKARRFVTTLDQVKAFCVDWADRASAAETLGADPRVLVLRYEDIVREKAAHVAKLEAFTGLQGVDLRVFDVKVNTFKGDERDGHAPTEYIAPARLSAQEKRIAMRAVGEVAKRLYGEELDAA